MQSEILKVVMLTVLLSAGASWHPRNYAQGVTEAERLLQKAMLSEDVDGDLQAAIGQYKKIVADSGGNRAVAAKALLRLAGCYEKLGREEAKKTYQQLVSDYPDQAAEVASARQKLEGLTRVLEKQAAKPVFQKITIPGKISSGAQLSPDGSRLAFVSGGDIWVVNLRGRVAPDIAGEPVRLTQGARAAWGGLAWSRNGEWIAFNRGAPASEIYVVPTSGGESRKLTISYSPRGGSPARAALSFSADGTHLAYATKIEDRLALHMASVATGDDVRRLADPVSTDPAFSPDGKFIAYVKSWEVKPYDPRSEVRVVRLDGQGDVRFTEGIPARARSPVWSPDGKLLAFLMVPGGDDASQEAWITPVSETGKAAATSTKISLPNTTYDSLAGWTTDNKIGLLFPSPTHAAIYTVPTSGGKATQVTPGEGFHPRWSPDGERIYFRHGFGDIAFVPASGGKVSLLSQGGDKVVEALPGGGNHISPDSKRIVFSGYKEGLAGVHLWTMPVTGGEPVRLAMKPGSDSRCPQWSPDGRWIAFLSEKALSDKKLDLNIYLVSSGGGEPRQLTHHTECFCQLLTWSPDGSTIAYTCTDGVLRIIPVTQGEPRTVIKVDGLGRHDGLAWTPDGARLVYSVKGRIWTVAPGGGAPSEINTGLDGHVGDLAISPDGRRIAFNASTGGEPELWLMEDFLSLVKK